MATPRLAVGWQGLLALFLLLGACLLGGAVYAWHLYCEGFGCVGIGIVWFAWAVASGVHLLLGLVLRARLSGRAQGLVHIALRVQLGLTLGLAAYWQLH
ncbi:hypothetical protein [Kinneretia aquatilis]|uniref:hypothetical protein n=1 Tax=Kinneretia aquatilis TaxID=2070761 RepID=UPI0014953857|nr:hypothetical protein [Paucibacter aquatile]WIV98988.1 hypothetical protein K9V56_005750 [Paucibacter aquatile]